MFRNSAPLFVYISGIAILIERMYYGGKEFRSGVRRKEGAMVANLDILSNEVDRELLEQFRCLSTQNRESIIAALSIFLSAQEGNASGRP